MRVGGMRFGVVSGLCLLLAACGVPDLPIISAKKPPVSRPRPKSENAWTPRDVRADAVRATPRSVRVKAGDSLSGLARRLGVSMQDLARANDLAPPYVIKVGQKLHIPGGLYHQVKWGETGLAIAQAYDVPWRELVALNKLRPPYLLAVGQRLRIPERQTQPMTLEARAQAFRIGIDDLIAASEPAVEADENVGDNAEVAATPRQKASSKTQKRKRIAQSQLPAFSGRFIWPVKGRLVSRFGPKGRGRHNDGIDIATRTNARIRAAAPGIVAYAGNELPSFGNLILIRHKGGWVTAYAYNRTLLVQRGDVVKAGQVIARAGQTGLATRPQLHFEIRRGRAAVNPLPRLPRQ